MVREQNQRENHTEILLGLPSPKDSHLYGKGNWNCVTVMLSTGPGKMGPVLRTYQDERVLCMRL